MRAAAKKVTNINRTDEPIYLPNADAEIAKLAYYKAESRNFEPGNELDDWLAAEQEYQFSLDAA